MSKHDSQTIRELGYKGCIPYFILFDPDLTIQHMRLYSLIEQMESNPNPKVAPTFSYQWFGKILGIESRGAMKIAKRMKDKGYITHTQKDDGHWIWGTAKKMVIDDNPQAGVASQDTLNTKKNNYQEEENTKLGSSSILFSKSTDQNLLAQKLDRDLRTDDEFLAECVEHVDNHSSNKYPRLQRANALVKLLTKLNKDNIIFRPSKEEDKPSTKEKVASLFSDADLQLMQDAIHAKKMAGMGMDINIFMKPEMLAKAEELLTRGQAKESQPCQPSTPKSNAKENSLQSVSNLVSRLNLSR